MADQGPHLELFELQLNGYDDDIDLKQIITSNDLALMKMSTPEAAFELNGLQQQPQLISQNMTANVGGYDLTLSTSADFDVDQFFNVYNGLTSSDSNLDDLPYTHQPAVATADVQLPTTVADADVGDVLNSSSSHLFDEQIDFSTTIDLDNFMEPATTSITVPVPSATPASSLPGSRRCLPELHRNRTINTSSTDLSVHTTLSLPHVMTASSTSSLNSTSGPWLVAANSPLSPDQTVPAGPRRQRNPSSSSTTKTSAATSLPRYADSFNGDGTVQSSAATFVQPLTSSRTAVKRSSAADNFVVHDSYTSATQQRVVYPTMVVDDDDDELTSVTTTSSSSRPSAKRGRSSSSPTVATAQVMDGTPDSDKKERRRKQNRDAATRCRNKKKQAFEVLKKDYDSVMKENEDLKHQLELCKANYNGLFNRVKQHVATCKLVIQPTVQLTYAP